MSELPIGKVPAVSESVTSKERGNTLRGADPGGYERKQRQ